MGCYDLVIIKCPSCKEDVFIQSKAGKCNCESYSIYDAPASIQADIAEDMHVCSNCFYTLNIKLTIIVQVY